MSVFDEMGVYWAEIADQNPTERQAQFIKDVLDREDLVLDLACGTGRHMIRLSRAGFNMVGLDFSPRLLRIAKDRWCGVQLVRGDMRHLPFKAGVFSASISMDTSFGYLPSEQHDLQSLKELQNTLSPGADLIIDVFNREHLTQKYANRRREFKWAFLPILLKFNNRLSKWVLFRSFKWREYQSFFLLQKRTVSADGDRLRDLWVIYGKADRKNRVFSHSARLYGQERLQGLLAEAGFTVNQVYGDYDRQKFSPDSNRLILVAHAK